MQCFKRDCRRGRKYENYWKLLKVKLQRMGQKDEDCTIGYL